MIAYLVVSSVMLLNLLIAILSGVYEEKSTVAITVEEKPREKEEEVNKSWPPLVEQWAADQADGPDGQTQEEMALTTAAADCLDAGEKAPCMHCGNPVLSVRLISR